MVVGRNIAVGAGRSWGWRTSGSLDNDGNVLGHVVGDDDLVLVGGLARGWTRTNSVGSSRNFGPCNSVDRRRKSLNCAISARVADKGAVGRWATCGGDGVLDRLHGHSGLDSDTLGSIDLWCGRGGEVVEATVHVVV